MFIGLFQLGDWVPLHHQVLTSGVASAPSTSPTAEIYNSSASLFVTVTLAGFRPEIETGMFFGRYQLTSTGRHMVVYKEGSGVRNVECFDVEGGSINGAVISAFTVNRPEGDSIFFETDVGVVYQGLGPY